MRVEDGEKLSQDEIVRSKRINIDYAEMGRDYLLRFYIKDNPLYRKSIASTHFSVIIDIIRYNTYY